MSIKPLYTAESVAIGGRNGTVKSSDGAISLKVSLPKGLGGPGGSHANPESLFASAYAACFAGALHLVARQGGVTLSEDTSVTCQVDIGKAENGLLALQSNMIVRSVGNNYRLNIGADQTKLTLLVEKAHEVCPYSNATRGNMPVSFKVISTKF
jgi:Ohr subfamily peroxiredoxin